MRTIPNGHDDITGGHDKVSVGVLMIFRTKRDTTWSATEVGQTPVKSGLGGHEEDVFGVDDGVLNASPPPRKRERATWSECPTFSRFTGVDNDSLGEK